MVWPSLLPDLSPINLLCGILKKKGVKHNSISKEQLKNNNNNKKTTNLNISVEIFFYSPHWKDLSLVIKNKTNKQKPLWILLIKCVLYWSIWSFYWGTRVFIRLNLFLI